MAVQQPKSTTVVNQFERNEALVLLDKEVSCHSENLDVTSNWPPQDHIAAGPSADLLSYNEDINENREQLSPVNPPGSSLNFEAIPEPISYDLSLSDERQHSQSAVPGKVEETRRNENKTSKVFILHFTEEDDMSSQDAILQLASCLRSLDVDVTLDLFEKDNFHGNWNMWYESELKESRIVLCIITEDFYKGLKSNHVKGNSAYNLMSDGNIPFVPLFLEREVNRKHIPLSMRGHNLYCIKLKDIPDRRQTDNWRENFQSFYSFLTSQNRMEPPALGERVSMPRHTSVMTENEVVRSQPKIPGGVNIMSEDEKMYLQLKTITTPVTSLHSHNKVFSQLACNLTADWETLGRALGVSEANMYAIRRDNAHSVIEQAVKMFHQWLRQNGSGATIQVLATAIYESGSKYWELLKILYKYSV